MLPKISKKAKGIAVIFVLATALCFPSNVWAGEPDVSLTPKLLQTFLKTAGLETELTASDTELAIDDLRGSAVVIGIPETGVARNRPFVLEIDGHRAVVELTDEDELVIIDGDERIGQSGILGIIECVLSTIINTIASVITAILNLQLITAISYLISGVVNVIICILI